MSFSIRLRDDSNLPEGKIKKDIKDGDEGRKQGDLHPGLLVRRLEPFLEEHW